MMMMMMMMMIVLLMLNVLAAHVPLLGVAPLDKKSALKFSNFYCKMFKYHNKNDATADIH